MNKNKYKQYADLKIQIKELTNQLKEVESEIIDEVTEAEGNKLETKYATFSMMYRPKWKYTDELKEKENLVKEKIKIMKKEEETNGKAEKVSDGGFLRCQLIKS